MDFDRLEDRRGIGVSKWDKMDRLGVSDPDGLAMWIADMDFCPPDCVVAAGQRVLDTGAFGYFDLNAAYLPAIAGWMRTRHNWSVDPDWILTAHGLGNGVAETLFALTEPGDGVIIFTPVYHEFTHKIRGAGRTVIESPLRIQDGTYRMDIAAAQAALTGREKAVLFCSPHNPAGRVWTVDEQRALADFCVTNDLILLADEIHHDLIMPGHKHVTLMNAVPEVADRTVLLTAASKTFNIAGLRTGNLIVPGDDLRQRLHEHLGAHSIQPNLFGVAMTAAAYSPQGGAWVDALVRYLDANRAAFLDGVGSIPGVSPMPMAATYLAWVDFAGTGLGMEEVRRRVQREARIATSHGPGFGTGSETYLRFNIGTQRARVDEAVARLRSAFADL